MDPEHGRSRWDGAAGRMEVWYATVTDPVTGAGVWLHYELVSPHDGGDAHGHGWVSVFPVDGRAPSTVRFGPAPVRRNDGDVWFEADGCAIGPRRAAGKATDDDGATWAWDLSFDDDAPPVWTYGRALWEREVLPGCQFVPAPTARWTGSVASPGGELRLDAAPGNLARIYGHGSANRWGWLHADLGGGDVLEIVTAVGRKPGLRRLPPLAAVQLRLDGTDWPQNPLAAAPLFKTHLALPSWSVRGVVGRRRLRVDVSQPPDRCVALGYVDPDGDTSTCTNTERADVTVRWDRWDDGWVVDREWRLDGTGHAEVGLRP